MNNKDTSGCCDGMQIRDWFYVTEHCTAVVKKLQLMKKALKQEGTRNKMASIGRINVSGRDNISNISEFKSAVAFFFKTVCKVNEI